MRRHGVTVSELRSGRGDSRGALPDPHPGRERSRLVSGPAAPVDSSVGEIESAKVDSVLEESFPASDPPSWTGSISKVDAHRRSQLDSLVQRVRAEYLEMPGLSLTIKQAQRLWSLERRTCEALLRALTDSRFLRRTDRGLFVRHTATA